MSDPVALVGGPCAGQRVVPVDGARVLAVPKFRGSRPGAEVETFIYRAVEIRRGTRVCAVLWVFSGWSDARALDFYRRRGIP